MRGKIGIRPLNDGRDTCRYKVEGKCMEMAQIAKKIIEENVNSYFLSERYIFFTTLKHKLYAMNMKQKTMRQYLIYS